MRSPNINNLRLKPVLRITVIVLFVCVLSLSALWTRFTGLAERPLALDEYYYVESVHDILEFGVPRFSSGGYYFRGILQQYLTALSILLFGDGPFAYRLQSALFSLGTLVMAYFLGRQFLNRSWSIVLVAILTFSSWEIEFSRFARMYAGFEFVAICFFWSLYRHSFNARSKKRYITVALAVIAVLTHRLGIFVALFLFLPLPVWFNRDWRKTLSDQRLYIAISSMVLFIGLLLVTHNFHLIGVSDHLPRDFISPLAKTPHWLSFGTGLFGNIVFLSIAALAGACLVGGYVLYINRNRPNADNEEHLLGGLMVLAVCCAVFHQFAMSAMIILVVALREPKLLVKKPYTHLILLLVVIASFWFTILFFNQAWIETVGLGSIVRSYLRSLRLAFFAFPDLYTPVFRAWADSVPVLGSLLGVAAAWQIACIRKLSLASIVKNPVIPIVIVVIVMGFRPPFYIETRYSQFLYPLALCVGLLFAGHVGEIARRRYNFNEGFSTGMAIALCLFAFSMSEDFNAFHLVHLKSDTVAYRMGRYERFEKHWYPRWDFERPAKLVNEAASDGSRIVVSWHVNTVGYYLKPEFAMYWPREVAYFAAISRAGGTRELWSGKRLLSTIEELIEFTKKADNVWLVVLGKNDSLKLDPEMVWPGRVQDVEVFRPGRDERIEVWRIELR